MIYLGFAFSALWLVSFGYLVILDIQTRDLKRRLDARASCIPPHEDKRGKHL